MNRQPWPFSVQPTASEQRRRPWQVPHPVPDLNTVPTGSTANLRMGGVQFSPTMLRATGGMMTGYQSEASGSSMSPEDPLASSSIAVTRLVVGGRAGLGLRRERCRSGAQVRIPNPRTLTESCAWQSRIWPFGSGASVESAAGRRQWLQVRGSLLRRREHGACHRRCADELSAVARASAFSAVPAGPWSRRLTIHP